MWINLSANAIVFLLGIVALLDAFGGIGHKGDGALALALYIAIVSAPLWGLLFIIGLFRLKSISGREYLFPVPMLFMITFVVAVMFVIFDGFKTIC